MRLSLSALCERVGGRLDGPADLEVAGVAGIREAQPGELTFVANGRYLVHLPETGASAVIVRDDVECHLPAIRVADPYVAFLLAIRVFARPHTEFFEPGIHPSAVVHPSAQLGQDVRVGAHAVVDRDCRLGDRVTLGAGSVLMPEVHVGADTLVYPNVTVREDCRVGERCILHPGVVIGSDGFGFARADGVQHKVPQIGRVVVESDVEIGANTCIDRATTGQTLIQRGAKLDNLVQIAHNVSVGRNTVISSQSGLSGSAIVGHNVVMAGQVGLAGHQEIGDGVQIGGQSGVAGDVPPGTAISGSPARDHREWRRLNVHFGRLGHYAKDIAELRRRLDQLERNDGASSSENT